MKRKRGESNKNKINIPPFIAGMMIGCFSFVVLACVLPITVYIIAVKVDYHNSTVAYYQRTFKDELIQDLCSKNLIPATIIDCNHPEVTIRYFQMWEIMAYYLQQELTYFEIYSRFGDYEVMCHLPDRPPKPHTYRCAYEFAVAFTLVLVFDETKHVFIEIE